MPLSARDQAAARYRRSFDAGVEPPPPRTAANRALLEEVRQEMCQEARQEESASSNGSVVSEAPVAGQHLYIMQRSDAPDLLKIGRSNDPMRRAAAIQAGQCFSVKVRAMFPDAGSKEHDVHRILHHHRVLGAQVLNGSA